MVPYSLSECTKSRLNQKGLVHLLSENESINQKNTAKLDIGIYYSLIMLAS